MHFPQFYWTVNKKDTFGISHSCTIFHILIPLCFTPKAAANINIMLTSFIWKTVQNYTYSKCGAYHLRKMLVALSKNFSGPCHLERCKCTKLWELFQRKTYWWTESRFAFHWYNGREWGVKIWTSSRNLSLNLFLPNSFLLWNEKFPK